MSHDISRDSFAHARAKGFAGVRRLQGRMFTDADFNEQVDLTDRRIRDFLGDLIGWHGGPAPKPGFAIDPDEGASNATRRIRDLKIGPGAYYVDGIRVSNALKDGQPFLSFREQARLPKDGDLPFDVAKDKPLLVYLDVVRVPVTPLDDPALLDAAFDGRDSSDRDRWAWVVRVGAVQGKAEELAKINLVREAEFDPPESGPGKNNEAGKLAFVLSAAEAFADDKCVIAPEEAYTGPENQLYRAQVHRKGNVNDLLDETVGPRFKWSRDNAAPAFAVNGWSAGTSATAGPTWKLTLASLEALGGLRSLEPYHWVELCRPECYRYDDPLPLLWVQSVDPDEKTVTLSMVASPPKVGSPVWTDIATASDKVNKAFGAAAKLEPGWKLVLWDHEGGDFNGVKVTADIWTSTGAGARTKYPGVRLEHNILALLDGGTSYRAGDYWLYPARAGAAATAENKPTFTEPSGPQHVYAPLAVLTLPASGSVARKDRRKQFAAQAADVPEPPPVTPPVVPAAPASAAPVVPNP